MRPTLARDSSSATAESYSSARGQRSVLVWQLLDQAVEECADLPRAHSPKAAAERFRETVRSVRNEIRRTAMGGTATNLSPSESVRRALSQLRRHFLECAAHATPQPDSEQTLNVLRAMERVNDALGGDAVQRFADRLSSPNALEAVIAVAHDVRSPLTSIVFLVDTIRNGHSGPLTPQQERQLTLVYSAALGLSGLANDLIELANGGEQLLGLAPVAFSIRECMYAVRDIVRPIAEEKQLRLELVLPKTDIRMGHSSALNRVLLNLTTNALKFTSRGRVELSVRELSRTRVQFSIVDTGRGIGTELMGHLFDGFRPQSDTGQYVFSSAGLGLMISQKLIAAMGGELKVCSELNTGTRMWFELELPPARRV